MNLRLKGPKSILSFIIFYTCISQLQSFTFTLPLFTQEYKSGTGESEGILTNIANSLITG